MKSMQVTSIGHNPYFNRWFSAIKKPRRQITCDDGHNPYFNRWFSAIPDGWIPVIGNEGHNPYFNRWFSAIGIHRHLV